MLLCCCCCSCSCYCSRRGALNERGKQPTFRPQKQTHTRKMKFKLFCLITRRRANSSPFFCFSHDELLCRIQSLSPSLFPSFFFKISIPLLYHYYSLLSIVFQLFFRECFFLSAHSIQLYIYDIYLDFCNCFCFVFLAFVSMGTGIGGRIPQLRLVGVSWL